MFVIFILNVFVFQKWRIFYTIQMILIRMICELQQLKIYEGGYQPGCYSLTQTPQNQRTLFVDTNQHSL
jgi:hypothetical protein